MYPVPTPRLLLSTLNQANHFESSAEESQVAMFLKQLGIKYSKITKDEFVTLMGILRKSDILKSSGSKRDKCNRKNDSNKKQIRTH